MSTQLFFGLAGAAIGFFTFGAGFAVSAGFLVGSLIGGLIDPAKSEGPRLGDLKLQTSSYGRMIPIVWGTGRLAGNVIDQTDLEEHKQKSGGKGGPEITNYTYTATFATALCETPVFGQDAIVGITDIWADGRLLWSTTTGGGNCPCTVYVGSETQDPDPTLEAVHGVGNVPAYRGIAYLVFADYELTDFGNRIPQIEARVFTAGGDIPWRVSSFSPWVTLNRNFHGATYTGGVITVSNLGAGLIYYQDKYDIDGTLISSTSDSNLSGWGLYCGIRNSNSVCLYINTGAGSEYHWFSPNDQGLLIMGENITGFEPAGGGASHNVYMNDFVYTSGNALGTSLILRYNADGGIPTNFVDSASLGGVYGADVFLGTSDTGDVYVATGLTGACRFWKFDFELNLLHFWDVADTSATRLRGFGAFHVYKNYVCFNYAGGFSVYYIALVAIDPVTFALSDAGVLLVQGGVNSALANLSGGLMIDQYGVFSLDPPPEPELLSTIVGNLSDMTPVGAYNVAELTDEVQWFVLASQMAVRNAIAILRPIYFFDAVESDDVVVFKKRGGASIATIPDEDLCGRAYGEDSGEPLITIRKREQGLPRTVTLTYIDVDMDYQTGAQSSPRQTTLSEADVTIEVPVGLTAAEASQKCWAIQSAEWVERETFEWSTTIKWAWLEPCDVTIVRGREIRILTRNQSPNGVIKWTGVLSAPSLYTQNQPGAPSSGFTPQVPPGARGDTELILLNLPLIDDGDLLTGFYAAMGPTAAGTWSGAALYKSSDGGTTYNVVGSTVAPDVIGTVATPIGDFTGGNVFDESNVLTVVLNDDDGELESATELAVLNGANMASYGLEVIQFKTATLTGTLTYELTGLRRGMRGTEWAMAAHGINETFVLLPTLNIATPVGELFQPRLYKAVTFGTAIADATAQTFTNTGQAARCYSPAEFAGGVGPADEVVSQWTPRTRIGGAWNDFSDIAQPDSPVEYVWEVWDATYSVCARSVTGITSPLHTYSAADQVTDFGALQTEYYATVGQVGQFQLGVRTRAVLPGAGATINDPLAPVSPYNPPSVPGTGGGGTVDTVLTWPGASSVITTQYKVGDTYVVEFTTGGSTPTSGNIDCAEYQDPPTFRHARLCADAAGLTMLPNGESWGPECIVDFGAGQCAIAASTTYYFIIKTEYPNGDPSGPVGQSADMIITLLGAP